jgi:hypothetical protein
MYKFIDGRNSFVFPSHLALREHTSATAFALIQKCVTLNPVTILFLDVLAYRLYQHV